MVLLCVNMNNDIVAVYRQRVQNFSIQQQAQSRRLYYNSIIRLVCFLVFVWFGYLSFQLRFSGYQVLVSIIGLAAFLFFVVSASGIRKKISLLQQLILINENEINILEGRISFLDNGASFLLEKGFTADLNVFGKHSLYHTINRTGSVSGKEALGNHLLHPFTTVEAIENYQGCAKELAGKIDFRQQLLAQTLLLKEEESVAQLSNALPENQYSFLYKSLWRQLAWVWPSLGVLTIGYAVYINSFSVIMLFTILGLLVLSFVFKKVSLIYNHISKRGYLFSQYAICFRLISAEKMEHPLLRQKQEAVREAETAFNKLSKLMGVFDLRLSLLSIFINGLFLSDLLCARAYLQWMKQYQSSVKTWFDTLGEIEVLNSLAGFHANHPNFIFPAVQTQRIAISASGLGHPLMKKGSAIVNDLSIGTPAKLHLITGSNMSGKSTFLRTVGLNLILAQIGAPVFAKSFTFHPLRLLTSFHHIDSLEESTSYFYAELTCLQGIIQSLQQPEPALVLLDEVMRGTNSTDKHDGTALLIKKLLNHSCLAMIATHDIELGVLANQYTGSVENFCFESELSENGLTFDFTMRRGVAQTKNATYLMQQMGIV